MREPIGWYGNTLVFLPSADKAPHASLIGFTGAGKSELLKAVAYAYISEGNSAVIVIEPSSKLVLEMSKWKTWVGNTRCILFDPKLHGDWIPCINPFETPFRDRTDTEAVHAKMVLARQLLAAFTEIIAGRSASSDVTGPMMPILYNCILTLFDYEGATMRDLLVFMETPEFKGRNVQPNFSDLNKELVRFGQSRTHYKGVPEYFTQRFRDQRRDVSKVAIANRLDGLITGTFFGELVCGKSTLDLEEAIRLKKVVLFNFGKGALSADESQTFGRLILGLVKGIAMRREFGKYHVPIHLIVDEAHDFVSESMEELLRQSRKYQCYLTAAQLALGDGMSTNLAKLMKGQTHVHIMGQARDDLKDAAAFVGCEVEDLRTLKQGDFYMSVGNHPPVRFRVRPDLAGDEYAMHPLMWDIYKAKQLKYYRPATPTSKKPEPRPEEPENSFNADKV